MNNIQATGDKARAQSQADAQWHSNAMVNHYAQMAVKDNNNYHQVLEIQGRHLEWSPTLQRNVEVQNY
jgi:ATP/maltotriose-dependent transcriptional regulator MalT